MKTGDKIFNMKKNNLKNQMYDVHEIKDEVVVICEEDTEEWAVCDRKWLNKNFIVIRPINYYYTTTNIIK